jgi:starch phosphorylase
VVRATVGLGELGLDDVAVTVSYGRVDETDGILAPTSVPLSLVGEADGGGHRFEATIPLTRTGPFGYTVRVLPSHRLLASSAELGLVANP